MGKQSNRKRKRSATRGGESPESRVFREHLFAESMAEDIVAAIRRSGIAVEVIDPAALSKLARPVGVVEVGVDLVPMIEPRGEWSHHSDFDRQVIAAGLWRYVRPPMLGDGPPSDDVGSSDGTRTDVLVEFVQKSAS
jgi:hypothetical protein